MKSANEKIYSFGPYRLDSAKHLLLKDGVAVQLREKLFETLLILLEAEGAVVSKDEFMEKVWPDAFVEENSLTRTISELRKTLSSGDEDGGYIETIPKRGYRLAAPVQSLTPENVPTPSSTLMESGEVGAQVERGLGTFRKPLLNLPVLLLVIGLSAALLAFFVYRRRAFETSFSESAAAAPRSIAILPFKSIDNGEPEYLGLGMADALITKLSNLKNISVRPTSSIRRYVPQQLDPLAAGRESARGFRIGRKYAAHR